MSTIFFGRMSCGELCQPAPSRISRAMALTLTHLLISARCWFMASILTTGMTRAAPVPRAGQMGAEQIGPSEPRSRRMRGRVPRLAQMRVSVALLANAGFILKPDFDRPAGKLLRDCGARQLSEFF